MHHWRCHIHGSYLHWTCNNTYLWSREPELVKLVHTVPGGYLKHLVGRGLVIKWNMPRSQKVSLRNLQKNRKLSESIPIQHGVNSVKTVNENQSHLSSISLFNIFFTSPCFFTAMPLTPYKVAAEAIMHTITKKLRSTEFRNIDMTDSGPLYLFLIFCHQRLRVSIKA